MFIARLTSCNRSFNFIMGYYSFLVRLPITTVSFISTGAAFTVSIRIFEFLSIFLSFFSFFGVTFRCPSSTCSRPYEPRN